MFLNIKINRNVEKVLFFRKFGFFNILILFVLFIFILKCLDNGFNKWNDLYWLVLLLGGDKFLMVLINVGKLLSIELWSIGEDIEIEFDEFIIWMMNFCFVVILV